LVFLIIRARRAVNVGASASVIVGGIGGGHMLQAHLVLLEARNITRFIFVTNKRRENAGASELITYLDRKWVQEALSSLFPGFADGWRIEEEPAELLVAGAGSVKVVVRDVSRARDLVTAVTLSALREAPGLDVCGMVSGPFEWSQPGSLAATARRLHDDFGNGLAGRPGPDHRFQSLPVIDQCSTTGLPAAAEIRQQDGSYEPRSWESRRKWEAYGSQDNGDGLQRLAAAAGTVPAALGEVVTFLEERSEWSAVVYADGNGLGEVFRNFDSLAADRSNRTYADELRGFSDQLARCTGQAFEQTVASLRGVLPDDQMADGEPPVLPLVLGGDDVIAVCDGGIALPFAVGYLRAFEQLTAQAPQVSGPLGRSGLGDRVAACAGVSIVKRHYPFTSAAGLAYQLMREAKAVKRNIGGPCSAISFEVLYDSTDPDLGRLRADATVLEAADGHGPGAVSHLIAQPYVVSDQPNSKGPWAAGRHWDDLRRRTALLSEYGDDGERILPASQVHRLREALFISRSAAEARFESLQARYPSTDAEALAGPDGRLFWSEPGGRVVTGLLDAMNAAPFVGTHRSPA
jgi:hypothetical protein